MYVMSEGSRTSCFRGPFVPGLRGVAGTQTTSDTSDTWNASTSLATSESYFFLGGSGAGRCDDVVVMGGRPIGSDRGGAEGGLVRCGGLHGGGWRDLRPWRDGVG